MLTIINEDITKVSCKYIVHQCNCVTDKSSGLAKTIFTKFPYADIYTNRLPPDIPGDIKIMGNGKDQRWVINLLGQYYPGKPIYSESKLDGYTKREEYFQLALNKILVIPNIESIAFPYGVGCGLAGGTWTNYYNMIELFSKKVQADVYICRFIK